VNRPCFSAQSPYRSRPCFSAQSPYRSRPCFSARRLRFFPPFHRYLDVSSAPIFGKFAFLPQAAAVVAAGAALSFDVPFALFIQTLAFVALNKVYERLLTLCI
jgi:hypothetical protein